MKILFTNPPWHKNGRYGVRAGSRWPFTLPAYDARSLGYIPFPFFLAYTAAYVLQLEGVSVEAIDAIAEGLTEEEYFKKITASNPDVVVAETSPPSLEEDLKLATKTRLLLPHLTYIVTGPQTPKSVHEILTYNPTIDFATFGEYEWTIRELIAGLRDGNSDSGSIKGLGYRNNEVFLTERRNLGDLSELPWPAWDLFPMKNYRDYFTDFPAPMVNMVASRGCPYSCSFCLWPDVMYGGQNYRTRSPKDIVAEMEHLVTTYGFRTIYFDDDTFNIGKERMLALCNEITSKGLTVAWAAMARADTFDEETITAMRAAGLYAIKYGVESGNQELLDRSGKKLNLDTVRKTVAISKAVGIKVHLTFTVGLPGETQQSISQTINLAMELDPDSVQMSIATPFPGTKLYLETIENGTLLTDNASLFDSSTTCMIKNEELSAKEIETSLERFAVLWGKRQRKKSLKKRFVGLCHRVMRKQ